MRKPLAVVFAMFAVIAFVVPPPAAAQDLPEFSADALAAYADGARHYQAGRYADAISRFTAAHEADETFVVALLQAAVCHSNLGNIGTRDSLLNIVEASKDRLSAYYRYRLETQLASAAGDLRGVLSAARRAAAVAPGTKALYQVAFWANRRNRPREARHALLSLDPDREPMKGWASYWGQLAAAHHMLGDHEAELAAARRAREQYPEMFFALTLEAQALAAMGRLDELESVIEKSHTATPGGAAANPGVLMATAAAELAEHGNSNASVALYARSADWYDERPADAVASVAHRNWRTMTLIGSERLDDAEVMCTSLLEDAPNNSWFHTTAGYVAALKGEQSEAMNQLSWLEGRERTMGYQAYIHAALGDNARAVQLLKEGFENGDNFTIWWHRQPLLLPLIGDDPAFADLIRPKG